MPLKAKHPCNKSGCPALTAERFCETHTQENRRAVDANRDPTSRQLYDRRWNVARVLFLRKNPLCVECKKTGRVVAANVVDHVEPHRGNYQKFWDQTKWQPMCKPHHDAKTAKEDGGFGNKSAGEK